MFAIALWDGRRRRLAAGAGPHRQEAAVLFLGRPPSGVRLRNQSACGRREAFRRKWTRRRSRITSPFNTFRRPRRFTAHVRKLRPAHYLVVEGSSIREVPYWDIRFDQTRPAFRRPNGANVSRGISDGSKIAAGQRRAAGGVSERRRGLVVGSGADERISAARDHLFDRLHRGATTTRRAMRANSPQLWAPIISSRSSNRTPSICYPNWRGTMTSRSPIPRRFRPITSPRWRAGT